MLGIILNRDLEIPLARQIYQEIYQKIALSQLQAGDILPSTRELARELNISRNTVCEAYDMLLSEGYITCRQGAATRIATGLNMEFIRQKEPRQEKTSEEFNYKVDFKTGQPDLNYFPKKLWSQTLSNVSENMELNRFHYSGPEGFFELRNEIARMLFRTKGIVVNPENIFITMGATQALHLLAELLMKKDKAMLLEDPCHTGMRRALQGMGYPIQPIPVDEQGMQTDYLKDKNAGAIYVTPSHQFPLGGILPAVRRSALIRYARETGIYIIEDDYDSEFRYSGAPISPLYSMDPEKVIYVGTFSKSVFPALRIGFILLPEALHIGFRRLRIYHDVQNPIFEQAALAEFLGSRNYDRHVRRMRKVYSSRRIELLNLLKEYFKDSYQVWGDAAGLHMAVSFPGKHFNYEFVKESKMMGLHLTTVDYHSIEKGKHTDKLLLGYGHLSSEKLREGVAILYKLIMN